MKWGKKSEAASFKAKAQLSTGKVSTTVIAFLHQLHTINSSYYYEFVDKTKLSYQQKEELLQYTRAMHDNARHSMLYSGQ